MKILFTGGGTGGHIFPIIAIVREIRRLNPKDFKFFYIGPKDKFSSIFLSHEGIKIKGVLAGKIRRYLGLKGVFQNLIDLLFKTPLGTLQAFWHIFFLTPDLIFSKGGYGSIPGVFSGWTLLTPVFLHESDVAPGLANKILSIFTSKVFVSFPETEHFPFKKMIVVGNPIRRELLEGSAEQAKETFKLTGEKPVILILGGSQGAQRINNVVLAVLPKILEEFELIHQVGEENFREVRSEARVMITGDLEKYYHPFPFLKEEKLRDAYRAASLIVSRAGSGTIFEIAALGKPSVLIPLPEAAQKHQFKNAYAFAQTGACVVIEEANLTPHFFLEKLKYLFSHPEELEKMQKGAKEFSRPKAAKIIASYIVEYLS